MYVAVEKWKQVENTNGQSWLFRAWGMKLNLLFTQNMDYIAEGAILMETPNWTRCVHFIFYTGKNSLLLYELYCDSVPQNSPKPTKAMQRCAVSHPGSVPKANYFYNSTGCVSVDCCYMTIKWSTRNMIIVHCYLEVDSHHFLPV